MRFCHDLLGVTPARLGFFWEKCFCIENGGSYGLDVKWWNVENKIPHLMAIMSARHNARAEVRARLKFKILLPPIYISRGHQMHQNSTFERLVGVFCQRETKKHCFRSIILRFHAFWANISNFGKIWNFMIFWKNQHFLLFLLKIAENTQKVLHRVLFFENSIWLKMR